MPREIVILNQPLRRRESKSGKVRFTVEIKSEPLIFDPDSVEKTIASQVAESIAAALRRQVQEISVTAAPATIKARKAAAKAFAKGEPAAVKRYSGGKLGAMPPGSGDKLFNDSGRFARGIVAQARPGGFTINIPANRLTDDVAVRMFARLAELVPGFRDQRRLFEAREVADAMRVVQKSLVQKLPEMRDEVSQARARAVSGVIAQTLLRAVLAA